MYSGATVVFGTLVPRAICSGDARQVRLAPVWISDPIWRLTIAYLRLGIHVREGSRLVQFMIGLLLVDAILLAVPHVGVYLGRSRDRILSL